MNKDKRVVMAAIAIMFTLGTFRSLVVDKGLPSRKFLLGGALSAAMLSALADLRGDIARWFAYAVITGVTFTEFVDIARKLPELGKGAEDQTSAPGGQDDTTAVSSDNPPDAGAALEPVFLRGSAAPHVGTARRQNQHTPLRTGTA